METLLKRAFDIHDGEMSRALMMFAAFFLLISMVMIIKPVCISLFLSKYGVKQLPYAYILVALCAAPAAVAYAGLLKKVSLVRLIVYTLQITAGLVFISWIIIKTNWNIRIFFYIFYVFVAVSALICSSQFWLLANAVFNPREAKRLFGLIGAGAILGGITGGYVTKFFAPVVGSEQLLFACIICLLCCIPIAKGIWRKSGGGLSPEHRVRQPVMAAAAVSPIRLILESRHLCYLSAIVAVSVITARLVDYQFNAVASQNMLNEDDLAAFLGFWLSNLNIASLIIQLFVTRRVVGIFGVGTSLFFLPIGILAGTAGLIFHPSLAAAVVLKVADGSLKNSLNKAGLELLALPVPGETKNQTKTFIDVFVDSFATGIGGILLLLLTFGFGVNVQGISVAVIILVMVWLHIAYRAKSTYIDTFRERIAQPKDGRSRPLPDFKKESVIGGLVLALGEKDERQLLRALRMAYETRNEKLVPSFADLVTHRSPRVRTEALRNLYFYKSADVSAVAKTFLAEADPELRTEAIQYLYARSGEGIDVLQSMLDSADPAAGTAALVAAAKEARKNSRLKKILNLNSRIQTALRNAHRHQQPDTVRSAKIACARAISLIPCRELYPYLHILLNDSDPKVVQATLASIGDTAAPEFIPVLIRLLGKKRIRSSAYDALKKYGPDIIEILGGYIHNPFLERSIRKYIPGVIAHAGVQKAVDFLAGHLDQPDINIRFEVIKALNRLRKNTPQLRFEHAGIKKKLLEEAAEYVKKLTALHTELVDIKQSGKEPTGLSVVETKELAAARGLLVKALEDRLEANFERIFRLLGLNYPPDDVYSAYLGVRSSVSNMRVHALELLDNILDVDIKRVIIPIVETAVIGAGHDIELARLNIASPPSVFDCLSALLDSDDPYLQERVLNVAGYFRDDRYLLHFGNLINSPEPAVRNMAKFALRKIGLYGQEKLTEPDR